MTSALLGAVSVLASSTTRYVSLSGTDNLTCNPAPCRHVQWAVDRAVAGDTIRIYSGTYEEQVTVTKSLNFEGDGIDATIIKGPPNTKDFDTFGQTFIFELSGPIVDNVTRLTVSGPGGPNGGNMCQPNRVSLDMGVVVAHGATLNMQNAAVRDIRDQPESGCQRGTAISIGRPGGFDPSFCGGNCVGHATITQVAVTDYQKNGVAVRGSGSTLDLFSNFITRAASPIIASNGAEVLTGARGYIHDNLITGNECNAAVCGLTQYQGSGVLVSQADSGTTVRDNVISSNDIGIYTNTGILVADNNASGNRFESILISAPATGAMVRGNTTNDGGYGIYVRNASGNTFEFDSSHRNRIYDMYTNNVFNTFHSNSCETAIPNPQQWDCTQPECQEADGSGRFQGRQQGDFTADNDGCKDGNPNTVQSTNRGDGKSFRSTRIDSLKFDSIAHSLTVTGVGLAGGLPVTFIFVEVETLPTTPGWVSFVFSDGYTNAGPLLTGSVRLH
jgi:hypothetical protein